MSHGLVSPTGGERRAGRRWLPALVSGGLLIALLAHVDLEVVRSLIARADLRWVLAVIAVQLLDRLLMTWKWWLLINARESHLSFGAAFKIYYISSFQGFLIPFGVGSDIIRFLKLRRHPIPPETVVASLVVERALGLLATGLMALAALVLLLTRIRADQLPDWVSLVLVVTASGAALAMALLLHPGVRRRLLATRPAGWLESKMPVASYLEAIGEYRDDRGLLARFGAWSVAEQFASVLAVYFAARALAIPLGFIDCLAFVPISTLLERLPLSVLGLGVREGSFALFLALFGIDYSSAIVLGLFEFAIFVLTMVPAGIWAAWRPDTVRRSDPAAWRPDTVQRSDPASDERPVQAEQPAREPGAPPDEA